MPKFFPSSYYAEEYSIKPKIFDQRLIGKAEIPDYFSDYKTAMEFFRENFPNIRLKTQWRKNPTLLMREEERIGILEREVLTKQTDDTTGFESLGE